MSELYVPLAGYGRNIHHDDRSWAYQATRAGEVALPTTVMWEPRIPAMDQGNLGRCVPTAGTALLATAPFWDLLPKDVQNRLSVAMTAETFAVQAYREVTALDPFPGKWEPDDTGSDGLSLSKLWRSRGYVAGWENAMTVEDYHVLIQKGAILLGISWLADMDRVGSDGVCRVGGAVRGGHEVLLYGYNAQRDQWWIRNSWGPSWGKKGSFCIDTPGLQKLLSMRADGIGLTPASQRPPQPIDPTPGPVVNPGGGGAVFPQAQLDYWASQVQRKKTPAAYELDAAVKYATWRKAQG